MTLKAKKKKQLIVLVIFSGVLLAAFLCRQYRVQNNEENFPKLLEKVYQRIEQDGQKFVFQKDSLIYWQTNTICLDSNIFSNERVITLKNGQYLKKNFDTLDKRIVWLYPIKGSYPTENKYVNNELNRPFANNKIWDYGLEVAAISLIFIWLVWLISLIKIRRENNLKNLWIILPLVVGYIAETYYISTLHFEATFHLYTGEIHFDTVRSVLILLYSGFLIYLLIFKLLNLQLKENRMLLLKVAVLLVLSLISAVLMQVSSHNNLKLSMQAHAENMSVHRNPEVEDNFVKKIFNLEADDYFVDLLEDGKLSEAEKYICEDYFSDISDNYHIGALVFNDSDSMTIQPSGYQIDILSYVDNRIASARRIDSVMCWVEDSDIDDNGTYIYLCKSDAANIFVECLKKKNSKNRNYSLLLEPDDTEGLEHMSWARYYKNELVYSFGNKEFEGKKNYNQKGWSTQGRDLVYQLQKDDSDYIVCVPNMLWRDMLGHMSLFFFGFILLIASEYIATRPKKQHFSPSLKSSVLVSLTIAFILGAVVSGIFGVDSIRLFNSLNNKEILSEKTSSIMMELSRFYSMDEQNEDLDNTLLHLSNDFLTDINVYDTNGLLISTSQKDIFERGYLSKYMNFKAKQGLEHKNTGINFEYEKIGKREFLASYCCINDHNNRPICYLNIPFISQQKTMDDNINRMINGFMNMFLLWTNISVLIFLILSNFITKPLRILKQHLQKIEIDHKNEKIDYNRDDEIGQLINTYNIMVDKIEESSLLLKQQERQESWRELAKQVAHDIKNPLTPMKLSIQYLQKLHSENHDLFEEKFAQISSSFISQIESISTIASELNSLSKPVNLQKHQTNLDKCIRDAIYLFDSDNNVEINYINLCQGDMITLGDEKLFVRIFNNLIKNSCQSFLDQEVGHIEITAKKEDNYFVISIKDDGCGIKDEDKDKIFSTHFSTKSEGSGLGLTIVKTIIESFDGQIDFYSKYTEGSTFIVKFKVV